MKLYGCNSLNFHGEVDEISDGEFNNIFQQWNENTLEKNIKVLKVGKDRIQNADQTGILYNQFPSCTFVRI